MKRLTSVLCTGCVVLTMAGHETLGAERAKEEQKLTPGFHHRSFSKEVRKTVGYAYLLFVPKGYGEEKKLCPMILFLHGAGERGDDLELLKDTGLPETLEKKKDLPFVVISPQCPRDDWWTNQALIELLDDVEQRYDVDRKRVYLTGLSMGGFGTWSLAMAHPDRFAAIVPICGGGEPIVARKLKDMPVWVFHGAKDSAVPLERSRVMVDAIKKQGGNVKFTVYPDAGHDSWTRTYNNPELYKWFLEHRKK